MDITKTMAGLSEAAKMIGLLEPHIRGEWISYFFEALEEAVNEEVLRTAQDILVERLLTGGW